MKELKELINNKDYLQAKNWIIEHREEIEQIVDCLLGKIEDLTPLEGLMNCDIDQPLTWDLDPFKNKTCMVSTPRR